MRPAETMAVQNSKVQIGDDRAIPASPNWAAMSHQQLYDAVHQGNNPSDAHGLAREWTALGDEMAQSARDLEKRVRGTESGWQGEAAVAARRAILELVSWSETAAATSSQMASRIADQARIAEQAKANMPEPVQFDAAKELANAASNGLPGLLAASADLKHQSDEARSAHDDAVHVMQTMESDSRHVDGNTPRFTSPPEVIKGSPAAAGSGSSTPDSPRPHRSAPASGSASRKHQEDEPRPAGSTLSAGAGAVAGAQVGESRSSAAPGSGGDTSGAAAAISGAAVGSMPYATLAAAAGGGVRGAAPGPAGAGSVAGGSAGTQKFDPVGSPSASTSSASYTPPPPVIGSEPNTANSSSAAPPNASDGEAGGPIPGGRPGTAGTRSSGSGSSRGRSGSANRKPGLRDEMRDPNYWAHWLSSGGEVDPSQAGGGGPVDSTGPFGADGGSLPHPDAGGVPGSTSASGVKNGSLPQRGTGGFPGSIGASGLGPTSETGAGNMSGGLFTSMSGQLPPVGAAGTAPDTNHAAAEGGAPGTSGAGTKGSQGGTAMGPMGAGMGQHGGQEKQRKSPGYVTGEKIAEEPGRLPPPVIGETFKKKRPQRD